MAWFEGALKGDGAAVFYAELSLMYRIQDLCRRGAYGSGLLLRVGICTVGASLMAMTRTLVQVFCLRVGIRTVGASLMAMTRTLIVSVALRLAL
jgi:hypothetical protein